MQDQLLAKMIEIAQCYYQQMGFEFAVTLTAVNLKLCQAVLSLYYDMDNQSELIRARQLATKLKNDFDIDLFVGLDYKLYKPKYEGLSKNKLKKASKKDFLNLCNNWIKKSLTLKEFRNPRLLYAEHPYVTVDFVAENYKIKIDIVLFFDLDLNFIDKFGPVTAVDR